MRRPVRQKLFFTIAGGTGILSLAMLLLVHSAVVHQVQENEDEGLQLTRTAFGALQSYRQTQLLDKCRLVSEIPYFRAAVSVYDPELPAGDQTDAVATVLEVAHRMLARVNVDLLVLTDERGRPLFQTGPVAQESGDELLAVESIALRGLAGPHADGILFLGRGLTQVTAVPMEIGGRQLGTLCLGKRLDSDLATSLEAMTGSAVALFGQGRLLARSGGVPPGAGGPLREAYLAGRGDGEDTNTSLITVDGDKFRTLWVPLDQGSADLGPVAFVVMRSEDRALAFLSNVRQGLITVALLAVGAGLLFSFIFARQLTTPIQKLVAHTEHLARGEFDTRVEIDTGDEIALLGEAFNRMSERLAESQGRLEHTNRTLEQRSGDLEVTNRELLRSKEQTEAVNRALEETHAQLIQAGKMAAFGELGASIAHELRQPLAAVRGLAQLVELRLPDAAADSLRHVSMIIDSIDHMTDIVQGLKDFSRKASFEFKDVDVAEVMRRTTMLLDAQLRSRRIKLLMDLETTAAPVHGDANQLQQVFTNLLANARDALGDGEGTIRVETRSVGDGAYLMVAVTDDGCGIPEDVLPKVFQSFFTTKPEGEGTGLGLAITHTILKDHGGRIEVSSTPGEGTTFRVFLPTREAKRCWEMIDCVRDCRPEIGGKEDCAIYREDRGHQCWETLRQLAERDPEVSRPACESCPVFLAKTGFLVTDSPKRAA